MAQTEASIRTMLEDCQEHVRRGNETIFNAQHTDMEDRMALRGVRDSVAVNQAKADLYRKALEKPYFGRIDVKCDDEEEVETYYVGEQAIRDDDAEYLVIDWHDPVGSLYYSGNETSLAVRNITFQLLLRRALDIQNGKLLAYKTEYDAQSAETLNGEIVDDFLLTVLKDKRRQKQLTNIIRTIQANQNQIIRKPRGQNIVVQGCAGSGKTMILLHRLSVLKYNNRDWDFGRTKILTPNTAFNTHINALSEELGLGDITRHTVEEYYVSLIQQYRKTTDVQADIHSETQLDPDFLREVYSLSFLQKTCEHYHAYWEQIVCQMQEGSLQEILRQWDAPAPDLTVHKEETVDVLRRSLAYAKAKGEKAAEELQSLQDRIRDLSVRIQQKEAEAAGQTAACNADLAAAQRAVVENFHQVERQLQQAASAPLVTLRAQELAQQLEKIKRLSQKLKHELDAIQQRQELYTDFQKVQTVQDTLAEQVQKATEGITAQLRKRQQEFDQIPFYNFAKKGSIKNQIAVYQQKFAQAAEAVVATYVQNRQNVLEEAQKKSQEFQLALEQEQARAATDKQKVSALEQKKRALQAVQQALQAQMVPEVQRFNAAAKLPQLAQWLSSKTVLQKKEAEKEALVQLLQERQAELCKKQQQTFEQQQQQEVARCEALAAQLEWPAIFKNVLEQDLAELHKKYGVSRRVTNYRFKLYLRLLYCYLYYRPLAQVDNFLCIDEAQDISPAEYQLLHKIVGEHCVFNLYGDVNQLIYGYKGITEWNDIADVTGIYDIVGPEDMSADDTTHVCLLNENYRNTVQITEFCNKEFDAQVTAIGVSGDPVRFDDLPQAFAWVWQLKQQQPQLRVAIVYKLGNAALEQQLRTLPHGEEVCWNEIVPEKICVLSVEVVKGLEFDAVVAVTQGMSNSEKYVTYTRALDHLNVVRAAGPAETQAPRQEKLQLALPQEDGLDRMMQELAAMQPVNAGAEPEAARITEEAAPTESFAQWLGAQMKEKQAQNYQALYELLERFCKKNLPLDGPLESIQDLNVLQQIKKRVRANRAFISQNLMKMPGIYKTIDLLAEYCQHVKKTAQPQMDVQPQADARPQMDAQPQVDAPAQAAPSELRQLLRGELLQPLVETLEQDGITTRAQFGELDLLLYINQRDIYPLRTRIEAWEASRDAWRACKIEARAKNGAAETQQAAPMAGGEQADASVQKPQKTTAAPTALGLLSEAETQATLRQMALQAGLHGLALPDVANRLATTQSAAAEYLAAHPDYIEILPRRYLHKEVLVDLDQAVEPLENILQRQFRRFFGFTNAKKLYEAAEQELSMFLNDNGLESEEKVFNIAKYLFAKRKVRNITHCFGTHGYIWQAPPMPESNRSSLVVNLARHSELILKREEIVNYLSMLGYSSPWVTYRAIMGIGVHAQFLQYQPDEFILAERLPIDQNWLDQVASALDELFARENAAFVVLRQIQPSWYAMSLPVLPDGLHWTPLLLQEIVGYHLQPRYRTIQPYRTMDTDALHAAIVPSDSGLVSFADLVYAYWLQQPARKADYDREEFRQCLCRAGMIQNNELRTVLPKALDDHRFAWSINEEKLHIVEGR